MSDLVERAKAALEGATAGPWKWSAPKYGVPDLMGRAGEPGVYEYDVEVLEADHQGECGCRSACQLELTVNAADAEFIAAARTLVPELVAEVERLQAGGPWVEHVERQRAMKRERDGDCICDGNPETSGGPEEDCPWHGREYRYWVEGVAALAADVVRLTPERIETIGQLDALPRGAVVRSAAGSIACRSDITHGAVFGDDRPFRWLALKLPAVVLWSPEDGGQ